MSLFLCLSGISLGRCCQKRFAKSGGFRGKIKREDDHIGGAVYRKGVQTFCTLWHHINRFFKKSKLKECYREFQIIVLMRDSFLKGDIFIVIISFFC